MIEHSPRLRSYYDRRRAVLRSMTKISLMSLALCLLLVAIMWPHIQNQWHKSLPSLPKLSERDLMEARMIGPRYETYNPKKAEKYIIQASYAKQVAPEVYELEGPSADLVSQDGKHVKMTAEQGKYIRANEELLLLGKVHVQHEDGHEFVAENVKVDCKTGEVLTSTPVHAQSPSGNLKSEGMLVQDRGKKVVFTGKTKLKFNPDEESSPERTAP